MSVYTPGLKRKTSQVIRKTRKLPIPGEVVVRVGDKISHDTEVAKIKMPGKFKIVQVAEILEINPNQKQVEKYMLKKIGDFVEVGEVIARRQSFL